MLNDTAKQALDLALAACAEQGTTIFGAIVSGDGSEIQSFNNGTDSVTAWLHNMRTAAEAIEDSLKNHKEA